MKTAGRENPNHGATLPHNRAHGAVGQNRLGSIRGAAKQEKFQPKEVCFFLTSPFIARLDTPVAIKAMAAKLARLVYRMLRYGTKYVNWGAQFYEVQQRTRQIRPLKQKAAKLGFQLVQAPAA